MAAIKRQRLTTGRESFFSKIKTPGYGTFKGSDNQQASEAPSAERDSTIISIHSSDDKEEKIPNSGRWHPTTLKLTGFVFYQQIN